MKAPRYYDEKGDVEGHLTEGQRPDVAGVLHSLSLAFVERKRKGLCGYCLR